MTQSRRKHGMKSLYNYSHSVILSMFSKGIPFFLLMNIIICDLSGISLTHGEIHKFLINGDLSDNSYENHVPIKVEQLLLEDSGSKGRHRRGIVLIDEDFDKFPDARVRQSWSGENTVPDTTEVFNETEKDSSIDDGSGSSTIEQDSTLKFSITPGELHEGSELTSLIETTVEGSGDDVFTLKPKESEEIVKDDMFSTCSNLTCDAGEITILPGFAESLSEDSTLILTCATVNFSNSDLLQWYKSNGSDNFHLEASIVKNQLQFAIPKVKLQDSGKYVCVRLYQQSCCHRQLDVTVYKKPNYKFHLLIVGLVALVSLFVCLLLSIHRRHRIKKFKKQIKNQIPMTEFLL